MSAARGHLRLFFGVPLAEPLRERAVALQRQLAAAAGPVRVKWVEAENLHLTLKFVGDAPAARLPEFIAAAQRVAQQAQPGALHYHGVGCFANRGVPRTIWIGLRGTTAQLAALAQALDQALAQAGLAAAEQRRFHAHVTLGRVRAGPGAGRLLQAIEALNDVQVGTQPLEGFALLSSELTSSGPIYTEQARFTLGGPRVGPQTENARGTA